ncbi:HAMP domain-containing sensor histidine kinase [Bdellovibrionota bacterium FG-2]
MILVMGILGFRAYFSARTHYHETQDIMTHGVASQALIARLETQMSAFEAAKKKFRITRDPLYLALGERHRLMLKSTADEFLEVIRKGFPELYDRCLSPIQQLLKSEQREIARQALSDILRILDESRQMKLRHAHDSALGLFRLIVLSLLLTITLTAWIVYTFHFKLFKPVDRLRNALNRIHDGELTFRVEPIPEVLEIRQLAESFNLMAERLESLQKAKGDFLATISHEIKNPLAALKEGLSFLTSRGESLSPYAKSRGFSACQLSAKRLESIIGNLLKSSFAESGFFQFDLSTQDLSEAIHAAIEEVRPLADKRQVEIECTAPSELMVSFNRDGIIQILENLLINAIKYGEGGAPVQVKVGLCEASDGFNAKLQVPHVEVSVENKGQGLGTDDHSKLFERFFRGDNSAGKSGLGLGLYVVKRIVEAHHGEVRAEFAQGRTCIRFWVPRSYETQLERRGA